MFNVTLIGQEKIFEILNVDFCMVEKSLKKYSKQVCNGRFILTENIVRFILRFLRYLRHNS